MFIPQIKPKIYDCIIGRKVSVSLRVKLTNIGTPSAKKMKILFLILIGVLIKRTLLRSDKTKYLLNILEVQTPLTPPNNIPTRNKPSDSN